MKFVHKTKDSRVRFIKRYACAVLITTLMMVTAGCVSGSRTVSGAPVRQVHGVSTAVVEPANPPALPVPSRSYDVFRGPNYTDRVVLTYDDCPKSRQQLLATVKAAKAHDIGLVLAPTGNCLEELGADIVDVMREHGQYVINHSVTHTALSTLSESGVVRELSAPGVETNYGRPPYGDGYDSPTVLAGYRAVGMKPWLWTVDTNDWQGLSASAVVSYAVANADKGDTVLMHMNHLAFNPESVLAIQQGLVARRLEVCRAYPGVTPVRLPDSLPC